MIAEGIELLDRLRAEIAAARARRAPDHRDSLAALEAMDRAAALTRRYLEGAAKLQSGSLEMARFSSASQAWLAAARLVAALELAGPEKALSRAEGWLSARSWRKLEKEDGGWSLPTVLDHCRALDAGFAKRAD